MLADEVGMGKTIQAVMVINALRLQKPELTVLIIVPDDLMPQWRDELLSIDHYAPRELEDEGEAGVSLVWEKNLKDSPGLIDPERYDLLIVDELHRLTQSTQARLLQRTSAFKSVLILTATPAFDEPPRKLQALTILEPDKVAWAQEEVLASLEEDQAAALSSVPSYSWPEQEQRDLLRELEREEYRVREALGELVHDRELAALTSCVYRRVIRTRRADFPDIFPRREYVGVLTAPLAIERRRQELMWEYFEHLPDLTREFKPIELAKRVLLGRQSLRQRVTYLIGHGHDRAGLLGQVSELLAPELGDSRLDELCDILLSIWDDDPDEQIFIAGQDNLTVEFLAKVLPRRIPTVAGKELVVARVKNQAAAATDLAASGHVFSQQVELFQSGEAKVLIAADAGQVGLNFQCARIIILYSVPWDPEQVEQWIGRLDRIGNEAVYCRDGRARPLCVYTIAQAGLLDEKIVDVLQAFNVFEQSVRLDGGVVQEVKRLIEEAALERATLDWDQLRRTVDGFRTSTTQRALSSPLFLELPWNKPGSLTQEALDPVPALEPVLPNRARGGEPREEALSGWLKLLSRTKEYDIRWGSRCKLSQQRYATIWYMFAQTAHRDPPLRSRVMLPAGISANPKARTSSSRDREAFILRKRELAQPPARQVFYDEASPKPLQLMNDGGPLHEALVSEWLKQVRGSVRGCRIRLPAYHPFYQAQGMGRYVLSVGHYDPAERLGALDLVALLDELTESMMCSYEEAMGIYEQHLRSSLEAWIASDHRWLRACSQAQLVLRLYRVEDNELVLSSGEGALALVDPTFTLGDKTYLCRSFERSLSEEDLNLLRPDKAPFVKDMTRMIKQRLSASEPELREQANRRASKLLRESEQLDYARAPALQRAMRALEGKTGSGLTRARNQLMKATCAHFLMRSATRARAESITALEEVQAQVLFSALIEVELESEPEKCKVY